MGTGEHPDEDRRLGTAPWGLDSREAPRKAAEIPFRSHRHNEASLSPSAANHQSNSRPEQRWRSELGGASA